MKLSFDWLKALSPARLLGVVCWPWSHTWRIHKELPVEVVDDRKNVIRNKMFYASQCTKCGKLKGETFYI